MGYQALLFCPDEKAARGVTQVLSELDFTVEPCTEPFAAVKKLMAQHFDAIVVDCDNEQNATLLFKSARNSTSNQSSLAVAVVEGQAGVAKAFRIGANLVLTKPINIEQAKGTLRVARGLLRKGGDAPKAVVDQGSAPATTSTAAVVSAATPKAPVSAPRPTSTASSTAKAWPNPTKSPAPRSIPADDQRPVSTNETSSKAIVSPKTSNSIIASKPAPASSQPAAPQGKYPWQASKPGSEPMASALKKAAEAAGISPTPAPDSTAQDLPHVPATPVTRGSAAAPAPAKEKSPTPPAPVTPPVLEKIAIEPTEPVPAEVQEHQVKTFAEEPHAPSFSMGAPAIDEEEPANSKKAIVILAIVVILASLAGYLGWKNMSDKSPAKTSVPPAQTSAVTPAASAPTSMAPSNNDSSATTVSASASPASAAEPLAPAQPSKPSAKMIAKDSTKPVTPAPSNAAEDTTTNPGAPALVVHNETSRSSPKPNTSDAEAAPAPSALGLTSSPDPNALSAIGNAPVAVPKASNQVVKVSQGVSEGLILKKVAPRYPAQALQMRMEGAVQMQATIRKDGSIANVKVLNGDPLLARSAQDAVRQWKYKPYYLDGEPVEIQTQITINFKLPN